MTSANNSHSSPSHTSNPSPLYQTNLPWVFSDFFAIFSGEGIHAIQREEPLSIPRASFPSRSLSDLGRMSEENAV